MLILYKSMCFFVCLFVCTYMYALLRNIQFVSFAFFCVVVFLQSLIYQTTRLVLSSPFVNCCCCCCCCWFVITFSCCCCLFGFICNKLTLIIYSLCCQMTCCWALSLALVDSKQLLRFMLNYHFDNKPYMYKQFCFISLLIV